MRLNAASSQDTVSTDPGGEGMFDGQEAVLSLKGKTTTKLSL